MRQPRRRLGLLIGLVLAATAGSGLALFQYRSASHASRIHHLVDPAQAVSEAGPTLDRTASGFAFPTSPSAVPDLAFVDGSGGRHTLAEFRGRPVILNIWATWCVPCRKEMPTLDHLQAELAGTGALVLPLSIDHQGPVVVRAFYKKLGLKSLGIYVDAENAASKALGVVGIPTTLLIDRQGREIGRKIGPAAWDSPAIVALIRDRLLSPKPARP